MQHIKFVMRGRGGKLNRVVKMVVIAQHQIAAQRRADFAHGFQQRLATFPFQVHHVAGARQHVNARAVESLNQFNAAVQRHKFAPMQIA